MQVSGQIHTPPWLFCSRGKNHQYSLGRKQGGPRANPETGKKRNISWSWLDSNPDPSGVRPLAYSLYRLNDMCLDLHKLLYVNLFNEIRTQKFRILSKNRDFLSACRTGRFDTQLDPLSIATPKKWTIVHALSGN
jgi:hypothetical protein